MPLKFMNILVCASDVGMSGHVIEDISLSWTCSMSCEKAVTKKYDENSHFGRVDYVVKIEACWHQN